MFQSLKQHFRILFKQVSCVIFYWQLAEVSYRLSGSKALLDHWSRVELLAVCESLFLDFFELGCLWNLTHDSVEKPDTLTKFVWNNWVQAWWLLQYLICSLWHVNIAVCTQKLSNVLQTIIKPLYLKLKLKVNASVRDSLACSLRLVYFYGNLLLLSL